MGEQRNLHAIRRPHIGLLPGDPLSDVHVTNDKDPHIPALRHPTHVSIGALIQKVTKRRDNVASGHPQSQHHVPGCHTGAAEDLLGHDLYYMSRGDDAATDRRR